LALLICIFVVLKNKTLNDIYIEMGVKLKIMKSINIIILISAVITLYRLPVYSQQQRPIPHQPEAVSFNIEFNGDSLKGFCLVLDFRSSEEIKSDVAGKATSGDVIIFISGHAQRVDDGYSLTSKLAERSKSGIVIIPVCDTPFGKKNEWRGDRGKDVILMEITRYMLAKMGISIKKYKPVTEMQVMINKHTIGEPSPDSIQTELTVIGWSHGALLARRLAHSYPDSVNSLVQAAPAGFVNWGGEYCIGPSCLTSSFLVEGSCVSMGIFRGEWQYISDISWGITKGLSGDTVRSCSSCISGNFSFLKPFRSYKDTIDCTLSADDKSFPLPEIKNITVIFAIDDTLFEYDDHGGIKNPAAITPDESKLFFEKFYPASVKSGARLTLAALPGNHLGPLVYSEEFADAALTTIGQRR